VAVPPADSSAGGRTRRWGAGGCGDRPAGFTAGGARRPVEDVRGQAAFRLPIVTAKSVGQWNREQSCSPAFFKQCAKQCAQQDADRATTCHELLAQLTGAGSDLSPPAHHQQRYGV